MEVKKRSNDVKLSKAVLAMKFMSRTRERLLQEAEAARDAALLYTPETIVNGRAHIEYSLASCFDSTLRSQRLSFKGMNPRIEKILEKELNKEELPVNPECEIPDQQMATFYNPLVKTMSKKFENKRKVNDDANDPLVNTNKKSTETQHSSKKKLKKK